MLQRGDKGQRQHLERCDGTPPRKTGIPFRKSLKQKMLELKLFGLMEFTQDYARSANYYMRSIHDFGQCMKSSRQEPNKALHMAKSMNTGLQCCLCT